MRPVHRRVDSSGRRRGHEDCPLYWIMARAGEEMYVLGVPRMFCCVFSSCESCDKIQAELRGAFAANP